MRKFTWIILFLLINSFGYGQQKYWLFFNQDENCHADPELLEDIDLKVIVHSKLLNAVSVSTNLSPEMLKWNFPDITSIIPVAKLSTQSVKDIQRLENISSDGLINSLGILDYGEAQPQNDILNISWLHDRGFRGEGIKMAIFDAGFYHVDTIEAFAHLWESNRITHWQDFVDDDQGVFEENHHGLSVMSVIAANLPGEMIGTAPGATYLLGRTETIHSETHQEEDHWVEAMEWADSLEVDIIHSSLGYSTFDSGNDDYDFTTLDGKTAVITLAANAATERGILVNTSAGNEGDNAWHYITAPCDGENVLCVGAVDTAHQRAYFSSFGPTADNRIKPDVMAMGRGTAVVGRGGYVHHGNGTSYAAPAVAGLAACLMQAHPYRNNFDVVNAIRMSGDQYETPDSLFGYGIPDARIADSILTEMDLTEIDSTKEETGPERMFRIFPIYSENRIEIMSLGKQAQITAIEFLSMEDEQVLDRFENEEAINEGLQGISEWEEKQILIRVILDDESSFTDTLTLL